MDSLCEEIEAIVKDGFHEAGFREQLGEVHVSDRPDLADFQCNDAMRAAKIDKRNPREIGQKIIDLVADHHFFDEVTLAGPGFINFKLSSSILAKRAYALAQDPIFGARKVARPKTIILDFGGANVAKPMHVGHLRSAVIGDCLQRVYRLLGHTIVSDVHLGDWGLQMGHLITELAQEQPDLPYFDPSFSGDYPTQSPVTISDLGRLYPQASLKAKQDPERNKLSIKATADLQAGRSGYRALLKHFIDVSREALEHDYASLGIRFDLWKGESDVDHLIAPMVDDCKKRKVATQSDGAWIIEVARETDKKTLPPLILVTREGSSLYGTTDLATILDRKQSIDPDQILYVVDQRQALHFEQVFRASERAGLMDEDRLAHIGFGTVNGTDGKPFKTREGGVMRLRDLLDQARDKALERMEKTGVAQSLDQDERESVATLVSKAAIRFADLSNARLTNYIFDLDRFMSFEGKTGPYLLYASVRMRSLLEKAGGEVTTCETDKVVFRIESQEERELVLTMDLFNERLHRAAEGFHPHMVADHAYKLAQNFSKFYAKCKVLSESDDELRASRIYLTKIVSDQLSLCLDLLGCEAPVKM